MRGDLTDDLTSHVLGNLDRRDIERFLQGFGQGHRALEVVGIVLRAPFTGAGNIQAIRRILDQIVRGITQIESGGIDEGFEGRTGLAHGLRGPVEGPRHLCLAPPHQRANGAIGRHHDNRGLRLRSFAHLVFEDGTQTVLCRLLNALIQRRLDDDVFGRVPGEEFRAGRHDPIGEIATRFRLCGLRQLGRIGDGVLRFCFGEVALLPHQADHRGRALLRTVKIVGGRQGGRRGQQTRQHSAFGGRHRRSGLSEEPLGCRFGPECTAAHVGTIEIDRQDVVLRILGLHRHGEERFLRLALQRVAAAFGFVFLFGLAAGRLIRFAQAEKFRRLLGDGRSPMALKRPAPFAQVDPNGRRDAPWADAEMAVETPVLSRDNRIAQMGRHAVGGYHAAELIPAPRKDIAFAVEQGDRSARAPIEKRLQRGQGRVDIADRQSEHEHCNCRHTPGDRPDQAHDPRDQRTQPAERTTSARPARRCTTAPAPLCSGLARGRGGLLARVLVIPLVCDEGSFPLG